MIDVGSITTADEPLTILFLGEESLLSSQFIDTIEALPSCRSIHHLSDQSLLDSALERLTPDLVLADFGVSDDSRQTYIPGLIMQRLKDVPVVAITAAEREYRGMAAVQLGAEDYLCIDRRRADEIESLLLHAARRRAFYSQLSQPENSVRSILHSINDGVIVVDRNGLVVSLNPAGRRILGLHSRDWPDAEWCRGFCAHSADSGALLPATDTPLARALDGGRFSALDVMHQEPGQPDLILSVSGQGLTGHDGGLLGAVLTFRDSTERFRQSAELTRLSSYDSLTGLANRRFFAAHLAKAIGRSRRANRAIAVLFVDLDRFKSVNDTLGHDVGDALLVDVAKRLNDELRVGDFVARWGGDEFVVALEHLKQPRDAAAVAQKLCLALSERYLVAGNELFVTPSIGVSVCPNDGEEADQLIKAADAAMYLAKRRGPGRFQLYANGVDQKAEEADELETGLRHAMVRNEFALHYQPRVSARTGEVVGLEALLRWQHPNYGLLNPARFLSILETSGLIHSVGEWVIDQACRQLFAWQNRYEQHDLSMTVNLSPQQLLRGNLVESVRHTIENTTIDPGCLELEVGEAVLSDRRNNAMAILNELRGLGVRVSVDHFGTRDVSIKSLDQGMVDSFVLHQSLIKDLESNPGHQRLVRATIAMAQGLEVDIGAEGIETEQQLNFLRECDCNVLQGHLLGRPMQAEAIAQLLRTPDAR